MSSVNLTVCLEQFKKRKAANAKIPKIDNASLPAGSNMEFYCRHCGVHLASLPEGYLGRPPTVCQPCGVLVDHGLV